jgi:hypothetical protein
VAPAHLLGFEARDQTLYMGYLNFLIEKIHTRPVPEAWRWIENNRGGRDEFDLFTATAPRYSRIAYQTAYPQRTGSAGTPFLSEAQIRLARAAIAVIRQVNTEGGGVLRHDNAFWAGRLKDYTSPFTGKPVGLSVIPDGCVLNMPTWRDWYDRRQEMKIKLVFPTVKKG